MHIQGVTRTPARLIVACLALSTLACAQERGDEGSDDGLGDGVAIEPDPDPFSSINDGDPRISAIDPHRFSRGGQTFYAAGYYPGAALNMTGQDYAGDSLAYNLDFIDALDQHGLNYFRIWANWGAVSRHVGGQEDNWDDFVRPPWSRTGPGNASDGRPKLDLNSLDPSYFELLRETVEYAADRGIVTQLILEDCWHTGYGLNFGFADYDFFAGQNNINGIDLEGLRAWSDPQGPAFPYHEAYVREVVGSVRKQHPKAHRLAIGDSSTRRGGPRVRARSPSG